MTQRTHLRTRQTVIQTRCIGRSSTSHHPLLPPPGYLEYVYKMLQIFFTLLLADDANFLQFSGSGCLVLCLLDVAFAFILDTDVDLDRFLERCRAPFTMHDLLRI